MCGAAVTLSPRASRLCDIWSRTWRNLETSRPYPTINSCAATQGSLSWFNRVVSLLLGAEPTVYKGVAMISLVELQFILCTPVNVEFVQEVKVVDGLEDEEAPVFKIDLKPRVS